MISNYLNDIWICFGIALTFCLYNCSSTSKEPVDTIASEVEAREVAFAKSMADRDFEAFLNFISPEALFFKGNESQRSYDAISQAWAPYFESETVPFSWHPDVIEVLESGHLALSSDPVRAAPEEIVGCFNSIW